MRFEISHNAIYFITINRLNLYFVRKLFSILHTVSAEMGEFFGMGAGKT